MLIWQKLLFVLYSLPSCSTENTYYVTPTPDTPCPGEPCHTLSQYAEHDFNNISSNTTLMFLPGDHTLNHTISFGLTAGLSNWRNTTHHHYPYHSLTLLGSPSSLATSRIVCTWSAGFAFSGITELHITALAFISCGHGPAVSLWSVLNSSIVNCTFRNNFSWQWQDGGHGVEEGVVLTLNSNLILTGCTIQNNGGYHRGALVVESSILTLTRCTIQSNDGGAVFAVDSILTLTENTFQNNNAEYGSALYIYANNIMILTHNTFQNNSATSYGGSVYVRANNTLMLIKNVFENNVAKSSEGGGGALYAFETNTLIFAENMFQDNSASGAGGALFVEQENTLILTKNVFQNNLAGLGGVFYMYTNNNLTFTGNTFQSNSANIKSGGALFVETHNFLDLKGNTFQNHSANISGGVLHAHTNNTLTLTGNLLHSSSALAGGALAISTYNILTLLENTFQNNSAIESGGVLYVYINNTLTLTENIFQNSSANSAGGALTIHTYNVLTLLENTFQNNFARDGGGIAAYWNNILTITQCMFQSNSANNVGGALAADYMYTTLVLKNNTFRNNLADAGGALFVRSSNILVTENTFQHNSAKDTGGVLYIINNSTITIINNTFQDNYADKSGGCLASLNNTLTLTENTFLNNLARHGGVLSVLLNSSLTIMGNCFHNNGGINGGVLYTDESIVDLISNDFSNNKVDLLGGIIFCIASSNLSLQSQHRFWNNTAQYGGGMAAIDCQVTLAGNTTFANNTATYGEGLYADGSHLHNSGWTNFINNLATKNGGGAYASRSELTINRQGVTFQENSALSNGGGIMLTGGSKIYLQPNTYLNFTSNSAKQKGGALMIEERKSLSFCAELSCGFLTETDCFFQIQSQTNYDADILISEITELHNILFYFRNNTALEAGATLYGGSIDYCSLTFINQRSRLQDSQKRFFYCPISGKIFDYITSNESLDISSDPLHICTCSDNETVCSSFATTMTVYPGGIITVPVLAHGQRDGMTPAVIHNTTPEGSLSFNDLEITQNIAARCTSLKYTVHTRDEDTFQQIKLYAEGPCPPREGTKNILTIHLKVVQCPPGFELSDTHPTCICTQRLRPFTNDCRINDRTIKRDSEFWMGYTDDKGLN